VSRHVVIVGPMGAGKTTLGRDLAEATGRSLYDSDDSIQHRAGRTGREIADTDGVAALHRMERDVFFDAIGAGEPSVVAAAASVIDDPEARRLLGTTFCVLVTASPHVLEERVVSSDHRRVISSGERGRIAGRDRLFLDAADLVIDTGAISRQDAVARVIAGMEGNSR
jgi:shikimate kinase